MISVLLGAVCNRSIKERHLVLGQNDQPMATRLSSCQQAGSSQCPDALLDTSLVCLWRSRGHYHEGFAQLEARAAVLVARYRAVRLSLIHI